MKLTGREYHCFDYYGAEDADRVIIAMGSVIDAIEETVDYLESDWELWLFWVIWIIVIGLCVFGFYYIDNEWIEN